MYGLIGFFNQALANEFLLTLGLVLAQIPFSLRLILLWKLLVDLLVKSSNSSN